MNALKPATQQYEQGVRRFALLFTRWMDTNDWSHPVMTNLAKCAMGGVAWLHSSQISGLRHGKLLSPGPRTFIAIARLNSALYEYKVNHTLVPNTTSSNHYQDPFVILEEGRPPETGWWFEVFCGKREPVDICLDNYFFTEDEAESYSKVIGRLLRFGLMTNGIDPITELDDFLREHYPCREPERLKMLRQVVFNTGTWTADQLLTELTGLTALTAQVQGPQTEEELVAYLKSAPGN